MDKVKKPNVKAINNDPLGYATKIVSVNELVKLLQQLSYWYYNTDEPLVTDEVFDILKDTLDKRDPKNKYLKEVGAVISKEKVDLPFCMFSLDKIKPDTGELDKWKAKYPGPYDLSDKLDGVSALLYKEGKSIKMYTRGNGKQGQDISHLITHVVSNAVKFKDIPNKTAIRGELEISKKNFEKLGEEYKNARNTVAGLVNSKHFSMKLALVTDFIAYSIVNPRFAKTDQMKKLKEWHFPVATNKSATHTTLTEDMLNEYLVKRRAESLYDIDGVVVVDSSKAYDITDCNPDHGFAFKTVLEDQVAETTILEVVWTPSMYGYLKPTIKVKPVKLNGVTIKQASAFNAKYIKDNVIGPGAVIKLVRSGDVIPHILKVLKPSKNNKPSMPAISYTWDDTNTNIIIKDLHGDAKDTVIGKKIANFFKKLEVKHISRGVVAKLVDAGYNTVIKIIKADHADLAKVEGLGATSVAKIFAGLKEAFKVVTLEKLLAGSMVMGQGMGIRRNKLIIKAYPNIMNETWDTKKMIEKIKEVEGFDTKTATLFATNFGAFKKFYKELGKLDNVDIKHLDKVATKTKTKPETKKASTGKTKKTDRFEGQKIVFTGFRDTDLEAVIEAEGGTISSSVSKNTTLVVHADTKASKYKKAIELGVKTMTKEDFLEKYK